MNRAHQNGATPAVRLRDVRKTYHGRGEPVEAVSGISLTLPRGSFTAIMGPSGSGKSTLMHLIGSLDEPTRGTISVDGQEISSLSEREMAKVRATTIGFVFQSFHLLPRLTARQNVALPLVFQGESRHTRIERAEELLERVGLGDRADHRPSELSGGQRQRVAIARALANRPSLLLADEPTGDVDTETGDRILSLFTRLHADGNTILMVTHDRRVAEHAEQIIHLQDGVLVRTEQLDESPQEVH